MKDKDLIQKDIRDIQGSKKLNKKKKVDFRISANTS